MNKYTGEFIGTFCLVFCGCGAIVVDSLSSGAIGHVGISLVFGLVVTAMIYAVGNVSGAHLNPAVTVGFLFARRIGVAEASRYVATQLVAAVTAALFLRFIFPFGVGEASLGMTEPGTLLTLKSLVSIQSEVSALQAFLLEVILTFILMFVVLNVSTGHMEKGSWPGWQLAEQSHCRRCLADW